MSGAVGGPDPGGQRRYAVAAGEAAPDGPADVAVGAAPRRVVAGGDRDDLVVAGVAVVLDALVAVAGGPGDHAAASMPSPGDGVVDGQTGAVGQRHLLLVDRVVGVPPGAVDGSPAAGDDVGAVVGGPGDGVGLVLGAQPGDQPDRHQPRRGCHPGGADLAAGADHAGTGGAVVVAVARAW